MELLFALILVGLMSRTYSETEGTFTNDEQSKCYSTPAVTYIRVEFPDGVILNNTNQGAIVNASTISQRPSLVFPCVPDDPYCVFFFCVDHQDACSQAELLLWHVCNVLNFNLDKADTYIKYTPPSPNVNTLRCIFFAGKQAKKLSPRPTNQEPQNTDIPKLIKDDGVNVHAATFCRTAAVPIPPKEPCPCKKPKKPCPPIDPKDSCTHLLPKLPKISLPWLT